MAAVLKYTLSPAFQGRSLGGEPLMTEPGIQDYQIVTTADNDDDELHHRSMESRLADD